MHASTNYPYAPPRSFIAFTVVVVCGLPWLVLNIWNLFQRSYRHRVFGEITVHLIVYVLTITIALHFHKF